MYEKIEKGFGDQNMERQNTNENYLLEVKGLCKYYKDFAVEDINLVIPAGFIMGYVGRNGAGKTTTLNCISHLTKPDRGEIKIAGVSFDDDPIKYRDMIGYIGDSPFFPEDFNLTNVMSILKDFYTSFDKGKYLALCENWELSPKAKIKDYSRGMKVKLMFASVLSRETKLLILDEATNGLDPIMRMEILKMLQEYIEDGKKSVLFSTHIMEDLQDISDYIFIINKGREVLQGTKDDILEEYMIVKGGPDVDADFLDKLIGIEQNEFGFSALIKSDDCTNLPPEINLEKPTVDKLVVHLLTSIDNGGIV